MAARGEGDQLVFVSSFLENLDPMMPSVHHRLRGSTLPAPTLVDCWHAFRLSTSTFRLSPLVGNPSWWCAGSEWCLEPALLLSSLPALATGFLGGPPDNLQSADFRAGEYGSVSMTLFSGSPHLSAESWRKIWQARKSISRLLYKLPAIHSSAAGLSL